MSYRIVYGPKPAKPQEKRSSHLRILTAVFLLLFAVGVRMVWPEGREVLRNWLLPGSPGVTEAALGEMVEDLRAGEPVGESLTAFCRQVIHGQTG